MHGVGKWQFFFPTMEGQIHACADQCLDHLHSLLSHVIDYPHHIHHTFLGLLQCTVHGNEGSCPTHSSTATTSLRGYLALQNLIYNRYIVHAKYYIRATFGKSNLQCIPTKQNNNNNNKSGTFGLKVGHPYKNSTKIAEIIKK